MSFPLPLIVMLASGVTAPDLPGAPIVGQGHAGVPEGSMEGFALPAACTRNRDCPSGFCVQGTCCSTACPTGSCASGTCAVAPSFVSSAATQATCGVPYRYSETGAPVVSGDGPFIFGLVAPPDVGLPEGMAVDSATGEISWTPTSGQAGSYELQLEVWGPGGGATQTIAITVECQVRELNVSCGCGGAEGSAPELAAGWLLMLALVRWGARGKRRPKARPSTRAA